MGRRVMNHSQNGCIALSSAVEVPDTYLYCLSFVKPYELIYALRGPG